MLIAAASLLAPAVVLAQVSPHPDSRRTIERSTAANPVPTLRRPPTRAERARWALKATFGLESFAAGTVSAGWSTLVDRPVEYDTHWAGFGKRFGIRMSGVATSNAMEATLGMAFDEDPRYRYKGGPNVWARAGHAAKMTFLAERPDGSTTPAYARYMAISGSNFLSNTWRVESENGPVDAMQRTGFGFTGRFLSNLFEEFWPDVKAKVFGGR